MNRCPACDRGGPPNTLRCACGCLFLDRVLALPGDDAASLLASNTAWLDSERRRGRRMLIQGSSIAAIPLVLTLSAIVYGALAGAVICGSIVAASTAWAVRGHRRRSTARRLTSASQIALPPARLHERRDR